MLGDKYGLVGRLSVISPQNTLLGNGGATINLQMSADQQTWEYVRSLATENDAKYLGMFGLEVIVTKPYTAYIRATYDGDSQYASSVSDQYR